MISKEMIRSCISDIKEFSGVELACFSPDGTLVASTFGDPDITPDKTVEFLKSGEDQGKTEKYLLFRVEYGDSPQFTIVSKGTGERPLLMGKSAAASLYHILKASGEKFDRSLFLQQLLTGVLSREEIFRGVKRFRMEAAGKTAVFLIEGERGDLELVTDVIRGLYRSTRGDYVVTVSENETALIKSMGDDDSLQEMKQTAALIVDMANTEAMSDVRVSCGSIALKLEEIPGSFREARLAMEIGRIFYENESISLYPGLGVGRLIHRLPEDTCECFLHEIFGDRIPDRFDDEMLHTIDGFFDNNLNVSETARKLYVHRNTLLHRIEKIEKETGLDIRVFDQALTLKIALMVMNHLKNLKSKEG